MVSKIKSRVRLGITTIIPESENSLGAKVPCYNLIGTIQRLCAYSKAMISQGTRTSILNMQKHQQKVHSFRRIAFSPHPSLILGSPNQYDIKLSCGEWYKLTHFHNLCQAYNYLTNRDFLIFFLHLETQLLKNRN